MTEVGRKRVAIEEDDMVRVNSMDRLDTPIVPELEASRWHGLGNLCVPRNWQRANDANEAEYWSSLPSHIRSFVETTYHQGVALNPQEMAKSQAMLDLAHAMVDEAAGGALGF
ncbi:10916_t:CDS:2, partial [Acaulospora colombiana]